MPNQADWGVEPEETVIPPGAPPGSPRIVLGPAIPAELQAYYQGGGPSGTQFGTVIAAELFERDLFDYGYFALVIPTVGLMFIAFGGIEAVGLILNEAYRLTPGPGPGFGLSSSLDITGLLDIATYAKYRIDGISAPRGPRLAVSGAPGVSSGNALTTPAAESAPFSAWTSGSNTMGWQPGQVYKCIVDTQCSNNLAGAGTVYAWCRYQINVRSTISGTLLGAAVDTIVQNGHLDDEKLWVFYVKNTTAAVITSGLEISISKGASSIASSVFIDGATITVEEYGDTATSPMAAIATVMA